MKKMFKEAHKITKEMVNKYGVDYKTQFGLCLAYLLESKEEKEMDSRIVELQELSKEPGSFNKVWNKVESLSKEIRGRKFNRQEQLSFNYKVENLIALAEEILKEEVKAVEVKKEEKIFNLPSGVIQAKYDGYDAETGEIINKGDLIQHVGGLGWVRADNC